jgi:hypothetical protein
MASKPFPIKDSRVKNSPFAKGKTLQEAKSMIKEKKAAYNRGEQIGFTYVSSLKSQGLIPRSDGLYKLGEKYKNL